MDQLAQRNVSRASWPFPRGLKHFFVRRELLIPGLTIEFFKEGLDGFDVTVGELSNVNASPSAWDAEHALINHPDNVVQGGGADSYSTRITFQFSTPASSVGVGLAGFQSLASNAPLTDHFLIVNGIAIQETLEALAAPDFMGHSRFRNAYIRLDAAEGMNITSVGIENISFDELLEFDHLAVQYVPEPESLLLMAGCATLAILWRVGRIR